MITSLEEQHEYAYIQGGMDITAHVLKNESHLLLKQSHVPVECIEKATGIRSAVSIIRGSHAR
jgi:hypothetical protein